MKKKVEHKFFFHMTSIITDYFPKTGASFLDFLIENIVGSKILSKFFSLKAKKTIKKLKKFDQFLVVSDLNIGDAIICSSGVAALRKIFPRAEIDYVIKKSTKNLIEGNRDISNLYPVFIGAPFPSENDLEELVKISESKKYDLIINYSPMINDKIFGNKNVINFSLIMTELVRNEKLKNSINNISYQTYHFIENLFRNLLPADYNHNFDGPPIFIPDAAIENAKKFLIDNDIPEKAFIILFNPDATAKFTRIPFNIQLELLQKFSELNCIILLGEGHVEKDIEKKLIKCLGTNALQKVKVIPKNFSLEEYTALIDFSDIFVTGDTGPLHLATARKYVRENGSSLRNKTAVFSIFGSTPPRIYGFDSKKRGFFPANQDAPSRTFISRTSCRNITCINKSAKTCRYVNCFQELNTDEIILEAANYLQSVQINVTSKGINSLQEKI
jgi:ADP-heptose:LPS heptosyltransferase